MAIKKMVDSVGSWNKRIPFPKDRYTATCIEEEFGASKSASNPMLTQTFEINAPETIQVGDRTLSIAGLQSTRYVTLKVKNPPEDRETKGEWNDKSSDKNFSNYAAELKACGYAEESIDDENPPLFFKGKTFDVIVYAKKDVARKSATPEQLKKGIRQGDPILDSNGKEIAEYQLQVETVLGLATTQVGQTF